ncbi:rhomboid family intramembrane serine protease [Dasania sp. GY-MA-18]|uniref:Rhomboid family intramembrane serine protease n=1 Tax=Dasania phycosphaerae TaxID=2950436 RepID=A0A9J6RQP3_9GAMM|nr:MULTISPECIES: rhomboid family intramembrane serine protease [Dasania]MCR8924246.1 rhomboid family intramembrane serine protease [Dasania sp. GY-MA-18]MCZ0866899.1 rhomboid family intramembrane serine protease [Dasania phycosphaerae]MCZ0870403.1 rhomboid family intramembrane serine protease [Dasania phycosphaerae]
MAEYKAVEAELGEDLTEFSRLLWQHKLRHRILVQGHKQYLLVANAEDAKQVAQAYQSMQQGQLQWSEPVVPAPQAPRPPLWRYFYHLPVTLIAIALSVLGYLLVRFDTQLGLAAQFTFFAIVRDGAAYSFTLPKDQLWRLLTPMFLHFSLLHIVFNMLWLWDLGRRVEMIQGSIKLLGLIVLVAMGSNLAQAMVAGAAIFGGMSGVIYGLLGYGWLWSVLVPHKSMHIPHAIVVFMLLWLVLCLMGFTRLLGLGDVANAAHVGGLLIGLLIGAAAALIERFSNKP